MFVVPSTTRGDKIISHPEARRLNKHAADKHDINLEVGRMTVDLGQEVRLRVSTLTDVNLVSDRLEYNLQDGLGGQ